MKSKPIKNTHAADGIPDVVKEMIAKDGLYIGKDPLVADAIVPMFVRKGIIYSMRIDKALEPDGFLVGTEISGPFNA